MAYAHPDPALWGDDLTLNPILRLDCAAWGLFAAALSRPKPAIAWLLFLVGCGLLVGLGGVFELTFTPERLAPFGYAHWALGWSVLRTSLIEGAAMCALLGLSVLLPAGRGPLATSARAIARLSYALYLVHVPVIYLGRLYGLDDQTGWPARAAITLVVVAAALAMRLLVERPVLALRDWLLPERPASAAVPVGATLPASLDL
jgi:peptidoglycan/LPS O-acetylase OafA/YrhL